MNIQDWFPLVLTSLISLQSNRLSRVFSNTTIQSISSSAFSFLYNPTLTSIDDYWKNHSFDQTDLCWQRDVSAIAFFPRSKRLLIAWLQSPSSVIMSLSKHREIAKDREAWCAAGHGVTEIWTRLSDWATPPPNCFKASMSFWDIQPRISSLLIWQTP